MLTYCSNVMFILIAGMKPIHL